MKKRFLAFLLVMLLLAGALSGCSEQMPLVYVQSVAELVGYGSIGAYNSCAGVVMAQEETPIQRDESRKLKSLSVEVGQYVNEGDILFTYDTSSVDLEVSRLKLEVEQLKNTISDLKKQIAQLEKEKKNAKDEDTKLAYTLQIQSLQNDQSESEYYLALKQNEIDALNNSKDTGEVRSPIHGEVKAINENGGYDPFTGMPLPYITLAAKESFRIKGTVNELSRDDFYVGQAVVIRSRVDSKQTWTGVITEIDMQAEDNNDYYYGMDEMYSSSSYPFYVQPNSSEGLLLGQHVFIEPDYGQTLVDGGLYLNAAYICGNEDDGYYVWAAGKGDKIEKRSITVGLFDSALYTYEIVDGLTTADRIAYPSDEIVAGAPITEVLPEQNEDAAQDTQTPEDYAKDEYGGDAFDPGVFDEDELVVGEFSDDNADVMPSDANSDIMPSVAEDDFVDEFLDDGGAS